MNTRLNPWKLLWVPAVFTAAVSVALFWYLKGADIFGFYKTNLRSYFFTGFLTAGSLSLSALTWTVVNLKEKLYGGDAYKTQFKKWVEAKICTEADLYTPLWNIKSMLHWTVVSCLGASFCQFSIGLIETNWAAIACIVVVIFASANLLYSVFILKKVLTNWFDWMREEPWV